ncbi:hypothetical protein BC943DRAFT_25350 [Umbelopsis sp. AD052]|nr:hypothetical protein BC943DRAFT_25350 [Umbelopsis sp. AD052]
MTRKSKQFKQSKQKKSKAKKANWPPEMFSTDKTNYLIIDTCTLLHCPDLIMRLVSTVYRKKLNFSVVIPMIVIRELLAQEYNNSSEKTLETYFCWASHPTYKSRTLLLAQQATLIYGFIKQYLAMEVPALIKQGNHETKHYPVVVSHGFLSCLMEYF